MEKKITKRDHFNTLLAMNEVKANPELVAFITNELDLLDKKNARRKTEMTETQKDNLVLMDKVLDLLTEKGTEMTCSAIAKEFNLSTQKTSPILAKLITDGKVEKFTAKRTNYFKAI